MRLFEVTTPDGRTIRQRHASLDAARAALTQPGYAVTAEVIGANAENQGGFAEAIDGSGPSLFDVLLERQGDRLIRWLDRHGYARLIDEPPIAPKDARVLKRVR